MFSSHTDGALNKHRMRLPDLEEAYDNMIAEKGRSEWVLMAYSKDAQNELGVSVKSTGREIGDLAQKFKDDKIMYAFAKIEVGAGGAKVFFLVWTGRKVAASKKKDIAPHKRAISGVIKATFTEVSVSSTDEVKEANLLQKLYSSRAAMDELLGPSPTPSSPDPKRRSPSPIAQSAPVTAPATSNHVAPVSPREASPKRGAPTTVPRPTRPLPNAPATTTTNGTGAPTYYRPPPTRAAPISPRIQEDKERFEREAAESAAAAERSAREKEERDRRNREWEEQQKRERDLRDSRAREEAERREREAADDARREQEARERRDREDRERREREDADRRAREREAADRAAADKIARDREEQERLKKQQQATTVTPQPKTPTNRPIVPQGRGGRLVVPPAFLVNTSDTSPVRAPTGPGARKPIFISPHPPRRPSLDTIPSRPAAAPSARKLIFSEPVTLSYGLGALQGKRPTMEDRHAHELTLEKNSNFAYFAVYDGHAGEEAAEFVEGALHKEVDKQLAALNDRHGGDVKKAMVTAFQAVDEEFEGEAEMNYWYSGTTAVTVLYWKAERKLLCSNVGDSRCVFGRGNEATALSEDHKPTLPREAERIRAAGKDIKDGRIDGSHAFSRALGDVEMKGNLNLSPAEQAISNVPEFQEMSLAPPGSADVEFAIVACDGLWDVMSNEEAVAWVYNKFVEGKRDLNALAEELATHAIDIGSTDNVSVMIVLFPNK